MNESKSNELVVDNNNTDHPDSKLSEQELD